MECMVDAQTDPMLAVTLSIFTPGALTSMASPKVIPCGFFTNNHTWTDKPLQDFNVKAAIFSQLR